MNGACSPGVNYILLLRCVRFAPQSCFVNLVGCLVFRGSGLKLGAAVCRNGQVIGWIQDGRCLHLPHFHARWATNLVSVQAALVAVPGVPCHLLPLVPHISSEAYYRTLLPSYVCVCLLSFVRFHFASCKAWEGFQHATSWSFSSLLLLCVTAL